MILHHFRNWSSPHEHRDTTGTLNEVTSEENKILMFHKSDISCSGSLGYSTV